jgi:hypothetical protein
MPHAPHSPLPPTPLQQLLSHPRCETQSQRKAAAAALTVSSTHFSSNASRSFAASSVSPPFAAWCSAVSTDILSSPVQLSVNERWPFGNRHLKSQGLRVQLPRNIHPWAAPSTSASRLSPSLPSATTIENSQRGASSLIRGFGLSGKYRASEVLRRCPCHSILSDQHERCLDMIL